MSALTDPWDWWVAPFVDDPDLRRALLAGLVVVVATALVGTWVVLRGLAFLGDALAHGVLPGVALALVTGIDPTVGAALAALAMVGVIGVARRHSPVSDDTTIGMLFVGMLALAVVIVTAHGDGDVEALEGFLFGELTGGSGGDLVRQAVVAVSVVAVTLVSHRAWTVAAFDERLARVLGLRPALTDLVLLVTVAVAIVSSFRTVGSLLVFAFLVAPPATAVVLVRRLPVVMVTAVVTGAAAVAVGLAASHHAGTAPAATVALVSVAGFFAALVARTVGAAVRSRLRVRRPVPAG